jgi:DNA mismatch repair protein MLH1
VDDSRSKYRKDDATSSGSVQQKGESSNAGPLMLSSLLLRLTSIAPISSASALQTQKKVYSQHKIRQSDTERTLDSMIPLTQASRISSDPAIAVSEEDAASEKTRFKEITESACYLTSVMNLRKELVAGKHSSAKAYSSIDDADVTLHLGLTEIIQKHIFVGIVDLDKCLSLVQHEAKLYLVNHESLA